MVATFDVLEGFDEVNANADLMAGVLSSSTSPWGFADAVFPTPKSSPNRGSGKSFALRATNTNGHGYAVFAQMFVHAVKSIGTKYTTRRLGVAMACNQPQNNLASVYLGVTDGGTMQCFVKVDTAGTVSAYRGDPNSCTLLGTAATTVNPNTLNMIELELTIDATSGVFKVWINATAGATPNINLSSQNTKRTGNTTFDACVMGVELNNSGYSNISWSAGTDLAYFDDLYVGDTQIGNHHVQTYFPSGAGSNTGWTPDSGSNYARVNETAMDGDTSYVAAASVNLIDTYAWSGTWLSTPTAINAIAVGIAGTAVAGSDTVAPVVLDNSTTTVGAAFNVDGAGYAYGQTIYGGDPGRSNAAWVVANVASLEFGVKRIS